MQPKSDIIGTSEVLYPLSAMTSVDLGWFDSDVDRFFAETKQKQNSMNSNSIMGILTKHYP